MSHGFFSGENYHDQRRGDFRDLGDNRRPLLTEYDIVYCRFFVISAGKLYARRADTWLTGNVSSAPA